MKPGDTDALTGRTIIHGRTKCFDRTYDLMPRNDRRTSYIEIAFDHMKVGPADAASVHFDQNFVCGGLRNRHIIEAQGVRFNGRRGV